jgi:hypothetical protein
VVGWLRLVGGRTRAVVMSSSDRYEALVSAIWGKGASLLWLQRGCNGHLNQVMNLVVATQSSTMVNLWGLGGVSAVAEEDGGVASRRRTVMALKRMGSNGLKNWPCWGE